LGGGRGGGVAVHANDQRIENYTPN
jgi:hypothetical protein